MSINSPFKSTSVFAWYNFTQVTQSDRPTNWRINMLYIISRLHVFYIYNYRKNMLFGLMFFANWFRSITHQGNNYTNPRTGLSFYLFYLYMSIYVCDNHHTCSTSEVRVDYLVWVWIQVYKHSQYKLSSHLCILFWAWKHNNNCFTFVDIHI